MHDLPPELLRPTDESRQWKCERNSESSAEYSLRLTRDVTIHATYIYGKLSIIYDVVAFPVYRERNYPTIADAFRHWSIDTTA